MNANESGTRIVRFVAGLEVIHGGVVIVFRNSAMGRDRVGHLNSRFSVELRIVRKHAAEHGDVGSRVRSPEEIVGRGDLDFLIRRQRLFGHLQCGLAFPRGHKRQLLDEGRVLVLGGLDLPERARDRPCDLLRPLLVCSLLEQVVVDVLAEALRSIGKVAVKRILEDVRRAPSALEALRRDADPGHAAKGDALRPAGVVSVEIGRPERREQVELKEVRHEASPAGLGLAMTRSTPWYSRIHRSLTLSPQYRIDSARS